MEIGEIPRNTQIGEKDNKGLEDIGKVRVDSLKEAIREIEEQIEERKEISTMFEKEGNKLQMNINNFLHESTPKGEADSEFARERAELRKKGIELNEMQLKEKVNCWKDVVTLKKDLRESKKELFEKESRIDVIKDILDGD